MNRNIDIPDEELDMIERYIMQTMSSDEYEAFTLKISSDAVLEAKVQQVRLLLLGIQQPALEASMEEFHKDLPVREIKKTSKVFLIKKWIAAATILVVIAAGALIFLQPWSRDKKLYSEYYKQDPGLITAMSTSDNYAFDRAMIDYKTGNYDSAIQAWERLLVTNPTNDTLNYFLGSSYLALDKTEKAITHLKKVTTINNSNFLNDAYWYLGLALLKEGTKKEAVSYIEKSDHEQKDALLLKLKE